MKNYVLQDLTYLNWSKIRSSSGTAGSYLKSYSYSNGKKIYYKLSFFDDERGIFGYESINEIIAKKLLEKLDYSHLNYELIYAKVNISNKEYITYLTSSLDFKEINESKITLENFYNFNKLENESIIDFSKRMGFIKDIYQMIVIDYLIANRDRHGANIEVLYNKKTKCYRLAPLYDHGLSLLSPNYLKEDIINYDIKKEVKANAFIGTSNLFDNLKLVPNEFFPRQKIDFAALIEEIGIDDIYLTKSIEMLKWRWNKLENLRDKK